MVRCKPVFRVAMFCGWAVLSTHAIAAFEKTPASAPADDGIAGGLTLRITARLIEEDSQSVPISVVSVSERALQQQGVTTAQGLQEIVPGLLVTAPNARLASFYIRGLGSFPFNEGLESSVAVFMDGVYLGRPGMAIGDLIDIERIEVARGPQGTLFGKNATAGTINIITRKPSFSPEASLDVSAGEFNTRQLRASFSGPLSAAWAGRLTAYRSERDGFITNIATDEKVNDVSRQGLRGQLLWQPDEAFSLRLIAETGEVDERCCAFPLLGQPRAAVQARDEYVGYQRVSGNPADRLSDSDVTPRSEVSQQAFSADAQWRLSERHKLISLSAYRQFSFTPTTDDNTSLDLIQGGTSSRHRQLSQELRIESFWPRAETIVGAYALSQRTTGQEYGLLGRDLSDWIFGGLLRQQVPTATRQNTGLALRLLIPPETLAGMEVITPFEQQSDSLAGFANLNFHATSRLDLSAGLRLTQEWKDTQVTRSRRGGNPSASPLALTNALAPLNTLLGGSLGLPTFNQLLDETVGGAFSRDASVKELAISGQLSASYFWNADLTSYASLSRGVKSGGVNLGVTGNSTSPLFQPEIVDSAEIGLKLQGFDQQLRLNIAAYYAQVQDYQAVTFDESPTFIPNPRLNNLLNVGQVTLAGVDVDVLARLPWQLSLRAGLSYNRAITDEFRNAPDEDSLRNTRDLSGEPLSNAPRWQGNLALNKTWTWSPSVNAYAGVDYWFRSEFNATIERSRASAIDGYGVMGARLGLRAANDRWDASVWARNLLDEDYISAVTALYGVGDYGAYAGDPRLVGGSLRFQFR